MLGGEAHARGLQQRRGQHGTSAQRHGVVGQALLAFGRLQLHGVGVDAPHRGFQRQAQAPVSCQYDLGSREPNIQVWNVNLRGDRSLMLRHFQHNDRPLHDTAQEVLKHVARLWGFGVQLESTNARGDITKRFSVRAPAN